jgi:tetratricopeptide (TPR) repeat protein
VNVENLLVQAYIGAREEGKALDTLRRAAAIDPRDEKLYLFATDACTESGSYKLGLKVADLGIEQLPHSAQLHYQRGMFLSHLDRADLATKEYHLAAKYAPGQTIAFMGAAQAALLNGDMPGAIKAARHGLRKRPNDYVLLAILGKALVRSGASPGQPEFTEALGAMEKAVAEQPGHAGSQITLGNLYLMAGKLDKAIAHLEKARALDPSSTAVYAHLASAYRRRGNMKKARQMLETLARLNEQKAATYRNGPSNERRGYLSGGTAKQPPDIPHHR